MKLEFIESLIELAELSQVLELEYSEDECRVLLSLCPLSSGQSTPLHKYCLSSDEPEEGCEMRQENALAPAKDVDQMIVEAALELMVENGFAAMSMRSLAKKVGLHAGSIYHHFSSKQDVLEEVLDSLLQQRLNDWWERKPKGAGVLSLLDAFVIFHVQRTLEHAREEHLVHVELHHLQGQQLSRVLEQDDAYTRELSEIIRSGVATGLFRVPEVELATRSLLGMLGAAASLSMARMSRTTITQMLTQMARRLLWTRHT